MATHSSMLAWESPWTEEPGVGYSPHDCKELDTAQQLSTHTHSVKHSVNISFFNPRGQPKR